MSDLLNEKSSFNDKQLFKEVSEGDERAFRIMYNRYYQRMYSFAAKVVKSPHVAEEIVQEVFIRLWEQRELLCEVKNPDNYVFIVIRNHTYNYLRAAAREQNRREKLWEALQQQVTDEGTFEMAAFSSPLPPSPCPCKEPVLHGYCTGNGPLSPPWCSRDIRGIYEGSTEGYRTRWEQGSNKVATW